MKEQALKFLQEDKLLYADMIDCIQQGKADFLYVTEEGVLLQDKTCGICSLAANDQEVAGQALAKLPNDFGGWIVAHGEGAREGTYARFPIRQETKTIQVVYLKDSVTYDRTLHFQLPDEKQLQIIKDGYDRESPENIQKIYEKKELFVAKTDQDEFVGFIGFHPEGSMGLLYIFPDYRRHGYAEETESFLMEECLKRGKIPYGHVVFGNDASMCLQKKLGFEQASQYVYWLRQ